MELSSLTASVTLGAAVSSSFDDELKLGGKLTLANLASSSS